LQLVYASIVELYYKKKKKLSVCTFIALARYLSSPGTMYLLYTPIVGPEFSVFIEAETESK